MDKNLLTFKAISSFVEELSKIFGQKHKPLLLYKRLIEKTGITLTNAIQKHVSSFKKFCVSNRECIIKMDKEMMGKDSHKISYNENVYIDMKIILNLCEPDVANVVWKHLLTISALVDPENNAKSVLLSNKEMEEKGETKEDAIINSIMKKVETSIDPSSIDNENPMEAAQQIIKSGVFNDLMTDMKKGFENGSLDLGKLVNSVQTMIVKSGGTEQDFNEMSNTATGMAGVPGLDIMSMMSMLSSNQNMMMNK